MATKPWHLPVRLATGAIILDQGLKKQGAGDEQAAWLHGMATTAFPQFAEMSPKQFVALLSTCEVALGLALIAVPVVPPAVAGAGLVAFAGCLNRLYLRAPGMREKGGLRPTQQGTPLAKDIWMTSIGAALLLDSLFAPKRRR